MSQPVSHSVSQPVTRSVTRSAPPSASPSPRQRETPERTPELRAAARRLSERLTADAPPRAIRRRLVIAAAGALAFTADLPGTAHAAGRIGGRAIATDPFTLGVASGDPKPGSVLLWTRLAPQPYEPGGGMPAGKVSVEWEIAHDARFSRVALRGTATAYPEFDHTVHVEAEGLDNDRPYHYRFRTGGWISPPGRTRTAPAGTARLSRLRFAAVSCQAYQDGYFTALRHLANEDLDLVLHLGDYIYEHAVDAYGGARALAGGPLPGHFNRETVTLEEYRLRYALYRGDPDLRAAHAAHPFVLTWDDHETDNNYAGDVPGDDDVAPEEFLLRRAAAYRAYWENQPLRLPQKPKGAAMRLYRRLRYGQLAQFDVLDTRQYRSDQLYGDGWQRPGPELEAPARTMTGAAQERWLLDGWKNSAARWKVVPQQAAFSRRRDRLGTDHRVSMDAWDGYPAARRRILAGAEAAGVANPLILTGDVHVAYGFDLKQDWDDPSSRTLGTEIVTTSVSSGRDGVARPANWTGLTRANPHLRFYDGRRGYVVLTLDQEQARADFRTVSAVTVPGAPVATAASYVTVADDPGLKPV
ncbi:alkaline phosphatase D family protein [Streptomyces sp. CAU 1734]|uniref:alkaline phosphatase D family protein n=1 Tax=Streptomyces sp. CAU 1734 TaxID=3140360 RepID=UPI0032611284